MKSQYRMFKYTVASVFCGALACTILPACEQGKMYCQVATGKFVSTLNQTSKGKNCLEKNNVVMNFDHYLGVTSGRIKRGDAKDARIGMSIDRVVARFKAAESRVGALKKYGTDCKTADPGVNVNPDVAFIKQPFFAFGSKYESYLPDAFEKCEMKTFKGAKLSIPALDGVPECKKERDEKDDEEKVNEEKGEDGEDKKEKGDDGEEKGEDGEDKKEQGDEGKDNEEVRSGLRADQSKPIPAFDVSYEVKNVFVRVSPAAQGNRVEGVLEYKEGDCEATYKFRAIWPLVSCKSNEDCSKSKKLGQELKDEGIKCVKDKGVETGLCALK